MKVVTDATAARAVFQPCADSVEPRSALGWPRQSNQLHGALRHIGIYAYRVSALLRLAALAPTPLETTEKLEQLRALENGLEIRVAITAEPPGADVNTTEDLARVAALLRAS